MNNAILIVDDEADARELLSKVVEKEGYQPVTAESGEAALVQLHQRRFAAALLDYQLPGMDGLMTLQGLLREDPDLKVVMITSHASIKLAVKAISLGAFNFLEKPFDLDEIRIIVKNAVRQHRSDSENSLLRSQANTREYVSGQGNLMQELWRVVDKVAPTDVPVLIEGESGTGKEVAARAIHQKSKRAQGPFVAVNCAALSHNLIESELFGHVKGSFTGAIATTKGRFESADGGTLFLDEIGEIALELQAKLLRALQEKTIERVGDTVTRKVDVRIITATNRNLVQAVSQKVFREDLFYRLNVVSLKMPALRERREDVLDLAEFFLARFSVHRGKDLKLSEEVRAFMLQYDFPGNIRELQNMLERASLLALGEEIYLKDLTMPSEAVHRSTGAVTSSPSTSETNFAKAKNAFEVGHLTRLLTLTRGNISQSAELAGMDRNNFKEKMRKHGLQWEDFKEEK